MSRVTKAIMLINKDLDSISGLDGIVAEIIINIQKDIHNQVEIIKQNFSNANIFDYYGGQENNLDNKNNRYRTKEEQIEYFKHLAYQYSKGANS